MALSFVVESEKSHESTGGIYFLAASTDGNDGPTDAAGAFASFDVVELCKKRSLNPAGYLLNNDSYTFFDKTGYLFKTGPTNTNVSDVQVLLIR
jgi:glycerate-2-kinase